MRTSLNWISQYLRSAAGMATLLAIGWQLLFTIIGVLLDSASLTSHLDHWDAGWYQHILTHSYGLDGSPAAPAFYPMFPSVIATLQFITFSLISPLFLGLLVNTIALAFALTALIGIFRHFSLSRTSIIIGVAAFLAFPSAFFMHVFYSEALFVALGFWAYLFALRRQWMGVGILLGILTAARLPGLLFVALCGLEYLRSNAWNIPKALQPQAFWFLLIPVGFIVYGVYLAIVRGDFFAMFHAYDVTNDWVYHHFSLNIIGTIVSTIGSIAANPFVYEQFVNGILPLIALAAIAGASIYCLFRLKQSGIPLALFGLFSIILFTLNSNVVSVHRYALPCLVIYIALSLWAKTTRRALVVGLVIAASFALQVFLYSKFVSDIFAG